MKIFVETSEFSKWQARFFSGDDYAELQKELIAPRKSKPMTAKSTRKPFAERLKGGLAEAVQFAKGELTLRTVRVPSPPPEITPKEVVSLRTKAGMSQAVFARMLNVSTKTVQSWEQGERKPSHAALRMLQVFRKNPRLVFDIVGLPIKGHGRSFSQLESIGSSQ